MSRQKWSRESIIEQITRLYAEDKDLRHGAVSSSHTRLMSAAIRYFGTWRAAVTAAGLDYQAILDHSLDTRAAKITKWTHDSILVAVRELAREGEQHLAVSVAREKHPALFSAATSARYYRSWRKAVSAAGFDYDRILANSRAAAASRGEPRGMLTLKRRLRAIGPMVNEMPEDQVQARYPRLYAKVMTLLGSWNRALEVAFEKSDIHQI